MAGFADWSECDGVFETCALDLPDYNSDHEELLVLSSLPFLETVATPHTPPRKLEERSFRKRSYSSLSDDEDKMHQLKEEGSTYKVKSVLETAYRAHSLPNLSDGWSPLFAPRFTPDRMASLPYDISLSMDFMIPALPCPFAVGPPPAVTEADVAAAVNDVLGQKKAKKMPLGLKLDTTQLLKELKNAL